MGRGQKDRQTPRKTQKNIRREARQRPRVKERYPYTGRNTQLDNVGFEARETQVETEKLGTTETQGVRHTPKREAQGRHTDPEEKRRNAEIEES